MVAIWDDGWKLVSPFTASSFLSVIPFDSGKLLMGDGGACVQTTYGLYC